jgi:hypothetical protein
MIETDVFLVTIEFDDKTKILYTNAASEEEAASKFHRYLVCHWIGGVWDEPEMLLAGVIDKIENGAMIY